MSLYITSLNSGSNGNCYYIGNEEEAVFIDAGISCKETEKRMKRLGLSMSRVKAIFVSHEHTDHIAGIPVLAAKYKLPVYGTLQTLQQGRLNLQGQEIVAFRSHETITIGGLSITAFPKFHDACDPHSFIIAGNSVKVGVFTDIGQPCDQLTHYFSQCHAAFLEANYDEQMLDEGRYPYFLKHRIRGGNGHLSNRQALDVFTGHKPAYMTHLLLAHLSKNNNCPQLVADLFQTNAAGTQIVVASRHAETPVYHITGTGTIAPVLRSIDHAMAMPQLSLF